MGEVEHEEDPSGEPVAEQDRLDRPGRQTARFSRDIGQVLERSSIGKVLERHQKTLERMDPTRGLGDVLSKIESPGSKLTRSIEKQTRISDTLRTATSFPSISKKLASHKVGESIDRQLRILRTAELDRFKSISDKLAASSPDVRVSDIDGVRVAVGPMTSVGEVLRAGMEQPYMGHPSPFRPTPQDIEDIVNAGEEEPAPEWDSEPTKEQEQAAADALEEELARFGEQTAVLSIEELSQLAATPALARQRFELLLLDTRGVERYLELAIHNRHNADRAEYETKQDAKRDKQHGEQVRWVVLGVVVTALIASGQCALRESSPVTPTQTPDETQLEIPNLHLEPPGNLDVR